jgi:hypothetical protein
MNLDGAVAQTTLTSASQPHDLDMSQSVLHGQRCTMNTTVQRPDSKHTTQLLPSAGKNACIGLAAYPDWLLLTLWTVNIPVQPRQDTIQMQDQSPFTPKTIPTQQCTATAVTSTRPNNPPINKYLLWDVGSNGRYHIISTCWSYFLWLHHHASIVLIRVASRKGCSMLFNTCPNLKQATHVEKH